MLNLPDYRVTQKVYESTRSVIYTGYEKQSEKPVVLKLLQGDYPEPRRLAQFQREYALTKQLAGKPGIIETYNLLPHQNSLLMVLEDFGGISFSQYLRQQQRPIPVSEFLPLAISMTKALGEIHQEQIMHKDLNPANIIFNPQTQQVKIIDFGISTQLSREVTTFRNSAGLEGTLAYISPEQTGRMNRVVDYRTDFYSLGATFYQLLSGSVPFAEADPLTLIHAHIARQATPLHELNPAIPEPVAQIVAKLMAKNAEERYLSTYGLLMDLQNCRQLWTETRSIPAFSLGQHDLADRLQLPQKLYGRQADISQIMAAFARASQGHTEIMLIAGAPGIGKSSLVQEIYRPITQEKGYFVTGKFEQLQRDRPYTAFIQACRDLVHQLLAETESRLTTWREQLVEALSGNGQLLIDVIPEIELIIGPQEPVPQLPPLEAQNRFGRTFLNFIRVFTTAEHPLAIFLDDLQWADTASLHLLQQLVTGQTAQQHLFIIGAYRDNEPQFR
ncbi:MAG: AAA family ATPase [Chloroflexota bacterium]